MRISAYTRRPAAWAVVILLSTASGAAAQQRLQAEPLPHFDLALPSFDLDEIDVPAAAWRPDDKTLSARTPLKPGTPDIKLDWVGIGTPPDVLVADAEPAAGSRDLGVKLKLRPPITLGFTTQFEPPGDTLAASRAGMEQSWLAAATGSVQMGPGLLLDTRAAWGLSQSDASGGSSEARKRLVDLRLTKKDEAGPWRFAPSVGLNYVEERHTLGASTPELDARQAVGSGRVDFRPELAYRLDLQNSMFIEPKAMVGGFWDIGAASAAGSGRPDLRLKGEAAITMGNAAGSKLQVGGTIEEGAQRAPDVWTGRLQLTVPLK